MLFNSIEFFVTFVFVLLGYYIIPRKMQWGYLLIVSYAYYFLMSRWYVAFLIFSTIITYISARFIEEWPDKKKIWLIINIVLNIAILVCFKYFPWMLSSVQNVVDLLGTGINLPELSLVVPIGISFYTFRVIGYIIDVYRGRISAEKNIGKYALYVSFFPQIVSGPIERSYNFIPQMEEGHVFDYNKVKNGFLLFLWGLLKKIVVADRLAILVDTVFDNVQNYNTPAYAVAMIFFSMQIYFDFAGYSDMAIGCTNMLGLTSIKNFDRPYCSKSIAEFWRRWHMSLSTWFRDYLYIPLGGNRVSEKRWACNMMIVFLVSGLWHGSNWTFVMWGGVHGIYQLIGKYTRESKDKLLTMIRVSKKSKLYQAGAAAVTFILATYAWMFFRANTIEDALHITKSLVQWNTEGFSIWNLGMQKWDLIFSAVFLTGWVILEIIQGRVNLRVWLQKRCLLIRWSIYLVIIFTCIMFGIYGDLSENSFIYFQF